MKCVFLSIPLLLGVFCLGQTDETIFREFRFDFTTPGARANALGKAFVGLADEATSAYNNPAGLTALQHPELTLEYRNVTNRYAFLTENSSYSLFNGTVHEPETQYSSLSFASFAFSRWNVNFSLFYVNQLDYTRASTDEQTTWGHVAGYTFNYVNLHRTDMNLNTFGLGFGRKYHKLSLGGAFGVSQFNYDYKYSTRLTSEDIGTNELVESSAKDRLTEPSFVLGLLYQILSDFQIGMTYKRLPCFHFSEAVRTLNQPQTHAIPITFKIPDSLTLGLSYLPTDRMTLLLDFNKIWYDQLVGDHFTVISGDTFHASEYAAPSVIETHFGLEYLLPLHGHILAFRTGVYQNPDHKTRFIGTEPTFRSDIQRFVFNTGSEKTTTGVTLGLGYVWKNKLQVDIAASWESNRFHALISSFLYRFGKK